ncbi:MAG: redoxin domain-containing protein, partial [Bacteroidota bacterium]
VKHPDSIKKSVDIVLNKSAAHDDVLQFFTVNTLNKYAKSKVMGMDAVYVHIVESVYMQGRAWWADEEQVAQLTERALAISPTILGRKAPNFRIKDELDNWTDLHAAPGKYTILYFWSYDCGHCQKETPKLAKIWADYKDKDVSLFTVSINGDVEIWKEKIKEYQLEGAINTQDHVRRSGFDSMYDIRSTPRVFVLDTEKNIIAKQISVEQVSEVLNHELGIGEVE